MKDFFRDKGLKIILSVMLILTGVSIICVYDTSSFTQSVVSIVTTPMQKFVSVISIYVKNFFDKQKSSETYEQEIKNLKDEIVNLRTLLIDYTNAKNENEQYSQYLKLKKSNDSLTFAPAEVIGRDPNEDFYGFTIDQGIAAGISVNDPVITSNGLVGLVSSVTQWSSNVKTLLSPEIKVGAISKSTRDSGVLIGDAKLSDKNLVRLSYISSQSVMPQDDMIVTSGLGGIYPRDLPIGKMKELLNDEYDSSRYAVIELFEDVRVVRDVFVVTSFAGKGKIEKEPLSAVFKEAEVKESEASE